MPASVCCWSASLFASSSLSRTTLRHSALSCFIHLTVCCILYNCWKWTGRVWAHISSNHFFSYCLMLTSLCQCTTLGQSWTKGNATCFGSGSSALVLFLSTDLPPWLLTLGRDRRLIGILGFLFGISSCCHSVPFPIHMFYFVSWHVTDCDFCDGVVLPFVLAGLLHTFWLAPFLPPYLSLCINTSAQMKGVTVTNHFFFLHLPFLLPYSSLSVYTVSIVVGMVKEVLVEPFHYCSQIRVNFCYLEFFWLQCT